MDRFVSSFTNKIDSKGRVSVPAGFRATLARDGFDGVYVYPALGLSALDAGGSRLVEEINGLLDRMPRYSDEHDLLSTQLYGDSEILKLDAEGRIVLSDRLKDWAQIEDRVAFVGLGHKFQLWEPERFAARQEEARSKVRELKQMLSSMPPAGVSGGTDARGSGVTE
jgi:MraZ protein